MAPSLPPKSVSKMASMTTKNLYAIGTDLDFPQRQLFSTWSLFWKCAAYYDTYSAWQSITDSGVLLLWIGIIYVAYYGIHIFVLNIQLCDQN